MNLDDVKISNEKVNKKFHHFLQELEELGYIKINDNYITTIKKINAVTRNIFNFPDDTLINPILRFLNCCLSTFEIYSELNATYTSFANCLYLIACSNPDFQSDTFASIAIKFLVTALIFFMVVM